VYVTQYEYYLYLRSSVPKHLNKLIIKPPKIVPIRIEIPINPYHIPLQPPTKKLIIMIARLIKGKSTIPILLYLSYLLSGSILFENIDAITIDTVTPWRN
jgi:hypothetical protein